MGFIKRNKTFLFTLFILLILTDIVLFINTWDFSIKHQEINFNNSLFYTLAAFFLVFGIVFYFLSGNILLKQQLLFNENESLKAELEKYKEANKEEIIKETINLKEEVLNLLPDEKLESLEKFSESLLIKISKKFDIVLGIQYIKNSKSEEFEPVGTYAHYSNEPPKPFKTGESLSGQVAKDQKILNMTNLPDNYIQVVSGLGQSSPKNLLIMPIVSKSQTISIIELASFKGFTNEDLDIFVELSKNITDKLNKFIK